MGVYVYMIYSVLLMLAFATGLDIEIEGELTWRDINISLPTPTAHQVIGYYPNADRVYLIGGDNVSNDFWSLQFNETYDGWNQNEKISFENLKIIEYTQSYFSSLHNIIYIKTNEIIHIYDMEIDFFNENVITLPMHLSKGCMTVYYDKYNANVEYLIIIGSKTRSNGDEPTTWIYKVDQLAHNISFYDVGPDLIGLRQDHCCTVLDDYLYVIGGVYQDTRFIEQWPIDINKDENEDFDDFTNIDTLINTDIAHQNLPQFGHRCIVNNNTKQIYVIGGITDEEEKYFNYSRYVFILERKNNTLYEMNYAKNIRSDNKSNWGDILPSLPMEIAYTAAMIDKHGYLNVFGGELNSEKYTNQWLRINTKSNMVGNNNEDVIWANRKRHNHNEQWALLILLIMVLLVGLWFKCISRISKLRSGQHQSSRIGNYTDGTAYDEITGESEIDDLEDVDIDDDNESDENDKSDQIYSNLQGILANQSDFEINNADNAETVV